MCFRHIREFIVCAVVVSSVVHYRVGWCSGNFFPVALQSFRTLAASHRFLELFRHMAALLGRVISPSQGLYLHRKTQHRKTRDKHPCLERDSNPRSQQPPGQDPLLRPHDHCDRRCSGNAPVNLLAIVIRYDYQSCYRISWLRIVDFSNKCPGSIIQRYIHGSWQAGLQSMVITFDIYPS
jgi:hypothetical protein